MSRSHDVNSDGNLQKKTTSTSSTSALINQYNGAKAARAEIKTAEQKVACGIQQLYRYATTHPRYDRQGIASVIVEEKALNAEVNTPFGQCRIRDLFPNGLQNGVTIHLYKDQYIRHPPAIYMLQQKIHSICQASTQAPYNLPPAVTDDIAAAIEKRFLAEFEAETAQIYSDISATTTTKDELFHQFIQEKMHEYMMQTAHELHEIVAANHATDKQDFNKFCAHIKKNSTQFRSDTHDILTFDVTNAGNEIRFSYDEAAAVTAHDRELRSGCANLSLCFEGTGQPVATAAATPTLRARITHSYVKHASPVAIHDINQYHEFALVIDTYRNVQDILQAMVRLRLHGRNASERNQPMALNWVYQLLTSNAFNAEKQADAYTYIVKVLHLLDNTIFIHKGTSVSLSVGVLNAGINWYSDYEIQSSAEQRRENRRMYQHLTNALQTVDLTISALEFEASEQSQLEQAVLRLKECLLPDVPNTTALTDAFTASHQLTEKSTINNIHFKKCADEYILLYDEWCHLAKELKKLTPAESKKNQATPPVDDKANAIKHQMQHFAEQLEKLKQEITTSQTTSDAVHHQLRKCTDTIEKDFYRENWDKNGKAAASIIKQLQYYFSQHRDDLQEKLSNEKTAAVTEEALLSLSAFVYLAYANELYFAKSGSFFKRDKYTNLYRSPEKAALFNAYLASFQHAVGMMASIGCKSANDRTFIMRNFIAALEGRPLAEAPLPQPWHHATLANSAFNAELSQRVHSHAAMFSCINDTGGGAAKVDAKNFQYLEGIHNLNYVGELGKYGSHKMKLHASEHHASLSLASQSVSSLSFSFLSQLGRSSAKKSSVTPPSPSDSSSEESPRYRKGNKG